MTIYCPYTYLIGWSNERVFYYGVRFAKGCHPDELWITYKTSSNIVKSFVKRFGDPDIIQIRKVFDHADLARNWENRVLKRINASSRNDFLNCTNNISIDSATSRAGGKTSFIQRKGVFAIDPIRRSAISAKTATRQYESKSGLFGRDKESWVEHSSLGGKTASKINIKNGSGIFSEEYRNSNYAKQIKKRLGKENSLRFKGRKIVHHPDTGISKMVDPDTANLLIEEHEYRSGKPKIHHSA